MIALERVLANAACRVSVLYRVGPSRRQDMLGFARLKHGKIVAETMPSVSKERWQRFLQRMRLEARQP